MNTHRSWLVFRTTNASLSQTHVRSRRRADVHPRFAARSAQPWHQHRQRAGFIAAARSRAPDDDRTTRLHCIS